MKKHIHKADGSVEVVEAEPVCSQDYCDTCGDCLACFGDTSCIIGLEKKREHLWIVYED